MYRGNTLIINNDDDSNQKKIDIKGNKLNLKKKEISKT